MRTLGVVAICLACASAAATFSVPQLAQAAQAQAARPAAGPVINLNTASATQLEQLPGVGPKTAARIIEYRQKNNGFKKVEEIMNVRGIGEKTFLKMKDQLTIAGPKANPQ